MRRLIASLAVAAVAISFSSTASAGLFCKKNACCEPAPVCCEPAPVACCEPAPTCCDVDPCCKPARKHHLRGLLSKLSCKKSSCCEPAPAPCCEAPAPAPAPCCAAPAPAPCCDAAPSCCDVDPCCKPARKHHLKALLSKLSCKKSSCCEPAPVCCEAPAPSCGCN